MLVHCFLDKSWTCDDEYLEGVEVEVALDCSVHLIVELVVRLVRPQRRRSSFPFPRDGHVNTLTNDRRMVRDDADVGQPCKSNLNESAIPAAKRHSPSHTFRLTLPANDRSHLCPPPRLSDFPDPLPRDAVPLSLTLDDGEVPPDLEIESVVATARDGGLLRGDRAGDV